VIVFKVQSSPGHALEISLSVELTAARVFLTDGKYFYTLVAPAVQPGHNVLITSFLRTLQDMRSAVYLWEGQCPALEFFQSDHPLSQRFCHIP